MRRNFALLALFSITLICCGCDIDALAPPAGNTPAGQYQTTPVQAGSEITIASFNIQVFGSSKAEKPRVMQILAEVVRRFDCIAIQELRTKDPAVMQNFVAQINQTGRRYDYIVGPRQGRTNSKEQYVFIFDTDRLEWIPNSMYVTADPQDWLHREPVTSSFRVRGVPYQQAFCFTLANIHTDPDDTDIELDALANTFLAIQNNGSGEDDVILLGDLNVDVNHLGALGRLPGIHCTVRGEPTNTRGSQSYDNIVFDSRFTTEFTGRAGVMNLMLELGLTQEQALEVSDHMPVWASFSPYESNAAMATRPQFPAR